MRAPASTGTGVPAELNPMRRLKNGTRFPPGPKREHVRVLEEELALLGEEQVEARQVDLLLIGFDLREIGAVGRVERQRRRQAVLDVEPFAVVVPVSERFGRLDLAGDPRLRGLAEDVRLHFQVSARA